MTDKLYKIVISLCMVVMLGSPFAAYAFDTRADYALLVDAETGVCCLRKMPMQDEPGQHEQADDRADGI